MPHSKLLDRHQKVLPSWLKLYYANPINIVRGFGRRLVDGEGREYLDFFGGIAVNSLGYNSPEVKDAIRQQLARGVTHTSTLYLIEEQVRLAEKIAALSGIPDAKVFFVNSGTEAVEAALLFATTARNANKVIALRNGYHGRSFASNATTAVTGWNASPLSPLQVEYAPNGQRTGTVMERLSPGELIEVCTSALQEVVSTKTASRIAAMIVEPMQGVGGLTTPPDGLLRAYQDVLKRHGIPLIVDEVQTGWGRLGSHFWGSQYHGLEPDAMAFAKGLGNGIVIGGVVGRPELIDSVSANSMSTFGGNHLAMTAGLATLEVIQSRDLQTNALKVGNVIQTGLIGISELYPCIGEIRGSGLLLAVEVLHPETRLPAPQLASEIHEAARRLGLLLGIGGSGGNIIRISPAMTLTEEEAQEGLAILAEAIGSANAAGERSDG